MICIHVNIILLNNTLDFLPLLILCMCINRWASIEDPLEELVYWAGYNKG